MQNRKNFAFIYLIIGVAFLFGWHYIQDAIWPPPQKKDREANPKELLAFVAGNAGLMAEEVEARQRSAALGLAAGTPVLMAEDVGARKRIAADRRAHRPPAFVLAEWAVTAAAAQADLPGLIAADRRKQAEAKLPKPEFIAMGRGENPFHLQPLLNTRGGSVQQVIVSDFQQADREGLPVKTADGGKKPLHLIPGVRVPRTAALQDQKTIPVPEIGPGPLKLHPDDLEQPSFNLFHYEKESDPQPVDTLGTRIWRVVRNEAASGDTHVVVFATELGAPHHVKITKTYTLNRTDYHLGLALTFEPHDRPAGAGVEKLRYQIDGPHGMPIEGEWYTTTYRQAIVGWADGGSANRSLETSQEVAHLGGSDRHASTDRRPIRFAGVMLQYFSAVLALDDAQPDGQKADYIEYVRFTPVGPTHPGQEFLDDLTSRAISRALPTDKPFTHPYVLYHGPVKVRLLKQLEGAQAVPEGTVDRYRDDLALRLQTDAHFPNFFGRVASFLWWTDIIIAFTNLIHSLLGLLSHAVPNLGICIVLITFMVRGLLHPFSRRQMINAKVMQAKQEKMAPELKKLQEKYGDDFSRMNVEKSRLMREHGINPAAMFGGCILLLFQMPVFMGLYYALQESVFFRLEPVFPWWMPNLAAPDMLVWWGEKIPWLSDPASLGNTLYLGPFLNILPLIAVALMLYTQMKMMPKSEDPQIQTQQKMMKFMMIIMLVFFYKSPTGLAIYFICSSLWGMVERRLIPKNIVEVEAARKANKAARAAARGEEPDAPKGWLGTKVAGWRAKWAQVLEEAQKQQQLQRGEGSNQPPRAPGPNQPPGPGTGKKKKKKR